MKRRSFLALLGLAPVAGAVTAASLERRPVRMPDGSIADSAAIPSGDRVYLHGGIAMRCDVPPEYAERVRENILRHNAFMAKAMRKGLFRGA